jgi:hypothetical protein
MKTKLAFLGALMPCLAQAANIIAPSDPVIAIDTDLSTSGSGFPVGEAPALAIDRNNFTKYLNFGGSGSGFIASSGDSWMAQSLQIVTGNDAPERDPTSYAVYGSNVPVVSANNSAGDAEAWTLIQRGGLSLPTARNTASGAINIINTTEYENYKIIFPTIRNSDLMQVSEVQLYDAANIMGNMILGPSNPVVGIDAPGFSNSRYPGGEAPALLFDNNVNTKFLSFGKGNSGFIVDPAFGSSVIDSFEIWTAGDDDRRDPSSYMIYGSTGDIQSQDNSLGDTESWTLISSGALSLPAARQTSSGVISIANSAAFDLYKVVFPTIKDDGTNAMQISGFQFYGTAPIPEPGTVTVLLAASMLSLRRRRSE